MQIDLNVLDKEMNLKERVINLAGFVGCESERREKLNSYRQELRKQFDDKLYEKSGLEWYQTAFVENFVFMYDQSFYDRTEGSYRIDELIDEGEQEFGGYDFIILWQAYPRIGIDGRNQFDFYRDMPGGLTGLGKLVERFHERDIRVFINYNPWDVGTRREDKSDAEVLADIIQAIDADGIFLDTMSSADQKFRAEIEKVNPNIVYNPEGVPSPKQAEFITGSWQQQYGAVMPPELMTIRWLEPRYSLRGINRATDNRAPYVNLDFFNGYGQVVWENIFGWWNPWNANDRTLLRKCVNLLREHKDAFRDLNWQPYVKTLVEGVCVHQWTSGKKTVYTLLNTKDKKVEGPILSVPTSEEREYYDVWSGNDVEVKDEDDKLILSFSLEPNSAGCIVVLPSDVPAPEVADISDSLENPYRRRIRLNALKPKLVSPSPCASKGEEFPEMVFVPGGRFIMNVRHNVHPAHEGSCYGDVSNHRAKNHPPQYYWLKPYLIDRTEVTNAEYKTFLEATHYCPSDLTNFLKLWIRPKEHESEPWKWIHPEGKEKHPVVWIDLDDARAYARWAGKRLPKEEEWQYAAQGPDYRLWPWGEKEDESLCNGDSDDTTPVDKYPDGASPFGCLDMSGNVWEWTESERDDGHTRYAVLRGGSHIVISGSIWYTASGAQPCDVHEKVLLMYPGLDRCANIGFRCVKDVAD